MNLGLFMSDQGEAQVGAIVASAGVIHVGQSFDDYRYEIINQAESKLRSYIEAASKAYEGCEYE